MFLYVPIDPECQDQFVLCGMATSTLSPSFKNQYMLFKLAGLAFPRFQQYYLATQLIPIHDWLRPEIMLAQQQRQSLCPLLNPYTILYTYKLQGIIDTTVVINSPKLL